MPSLGTSVGTIAQGPQGDVGNAYAANGGSDAAYIAFHRPGVFAGLLGIDTDNKLKYGGWSNQGVAYEVPHQGNTRAINFRDKAFYVTDYGAQPGADIANALFLARADVAANGGRGTIVVPAGQWSLSNGIDVSNLRVRIVGAGPGVTEVVQTGNTHSIYAAHNGDLRRGTTQVEGLSILARGVISGGHAIHVEYSDPADFITGPIIRDVTITGENVNSADQRWTDAMIHLRNAGGGLIDHVSIRGGNGNHNGTSAAIRLIDHTSDFAVTNTRVYFASTAFYQGGISEGVNYSKCYALLCNSGIYADAGSGAPGGYVTSSHFNCINRGIVLAGRPHWKIVGNEFYKWNGTDAGDWIGIESQGANLPFVDSNMFIGFSDQNLPGYSIGAAFDRTSAVRAVGNHFDSLQVGLDFHNNSSGVVCANTWHGVPNFLISTAGGVNAVPNSNNGF